MKIIIAGAGVVGSSLAEYLNVENHELTVIDRDSRVCNLLGERIDAMVIRGEAMSPSVLELAGIKGSDMLLAVSPDDGVNITLCGMAKIYGVPRRVARIRLEEFSRRQAFDLADLGVTSVIDPGRAITEKVIQRLETPGALDGAEFLDNTILLRSFAVAKGSPMENLSPAEFSGFSEKWGIRLAAISRNGNFVAGKGARLQAGDLAVLVLPAMARPRLPEVTGIDAEPPKRVVVSGESALALAIARRLEGAIPRVDLVDPSEEHSKEAAQALFKAEVLLGECTDAETFQDLDLQSADAFVAAGSVTEHNMMSCLLARTLGIPETIGISHEVRNDDILYTIGIGYVVNPRIAIAQSLMENAMGDLTGSVVAGVTHSFGILRAAVAPASRAEGMDGPSLESAIGGSVRVAALLRGGESIDTTEKFAPGDTVVALTPDGAARRVRARLERDPSAEGRMKSIFSSGGRR